MGNKLNIAMKFLVFISLDISKSGVTKEKTQDKIGNNIMFYKK